jgi:hypothetical protein
MVIYRVQHQKNGDIYMNDRLPPEVVEILNRLIKDNERLGHKVTALTFVCAYLLKEHCMVSGNPLVTLARMEGELGGTAEAIALQFAADFPDPTRNTGEISRLIDSMLVQASDSVSRAIVREQESKTP